MWRIDEDLHGAIGAEWPCAPVQLAEDIFGDGKY